MQYPAGFLCPPAVFQSDEKSRKQDLNGLHHPGNCALLFPSQPRYTLVSFQRCLPGSQSFLLCKSRVPLFRQQPRQKITEIKNPDIFLAQVKIQVSRKVTFGKQKIFKMHIPVDQLFGQKLISLFQAGALAFAADPLVMLLDEPTNSLDEAGKWMR